MRPVHRRLLTVGAVASCLAAAAAYPAFTAGASESLGAETAAQGTPVPGRYIVTLKAGAAT
ncbi:MAG: S8 family peptidase, partial [Actinomadura sp.]